MKQKEVLKKISKEIRDLHEIEIKSKHFYYYGGEGDTFIGIPLSLIESIEEREVVVSLNLGIGVLTLWKDFPSAHLTLFSKKRR